MEKMISEELVDLLNNTRIGKVIRIIVLDIRGDELKQELGTEYDDVYNCLRGENLSKLPPNKFSNLSSALLEKLDNMSKVDVSNEVIMGSYQLPIDFSLFQGEFSTEDFQNLKRILELTGINRLFIRNMREDIDLDNLPIESINFVGGKCNFKKLKSIKNLDLEDYDVRNLADLDALENLMSFSLSTNKEETEDVFNELNKLPNSTTCFIKNGDKILEHKIFIINPEQLREVLKNCSNGISIVYCGDGPIEAEWFEGKNVDLKIESTLALDDEFCRKMDNIKSLNVSITNDLYPSYSGAEISAINEVIRDILAQVPEDADDFTKVATVYKILAKRITYDKKGHGKDYVPERGIISRSLKGSLLEGKAVCVGFAEVLHKILNELGIESTIIAGKLVDGGEHEWNQVKCDGQWYNVDLTWDASCVRYNDPIECFLKSDTSFEATHEVGIVRECGLKRLFQEKPELLQKTFISSDELCHPIQKTAETSYDYQKVYDFFYKGDIKFHAIQTSRKLVTFIRNFSTEFLRKSQIGNAVLDIIQEVTRLMDEKVK